MKLHKMSLAAICFGAFFLVAFSASAGDFYENQKFDSGEGSVNWGNGEITATGLGIPPQNAQSDAQARALAKRAAVVVARRNLLEMIKGVKIVSETTVNMGMVEDDSIKSFVEGYVKGSQIIKTEEFDDGSVEVTVGVNMRGDFSETVLTHAVYKKPREQKAELPKETAAVSKSSDYTGIIFDASKLSPTQPCLSPKVIDMDGNEVYGSAIASREYVIKRGMAGYVDNIKEASDYELVRGNPIIVPGVQRKSSTTIIITNEDAAKIREVNKNSGLLEQCKVVIVL